MSTEEPTVAGLAELQKKCARLEAERKEAIRHKLIPDHDLIVDPADPTQGRTCEVCRLPVPAGAQYVHAEWCRSR